MKNKEPIGLLQVATHNNAHMMQCYNYAKLALQYFSTARSALLNLLRLIKSVQTRKLFHILTTLLLKKLSVILLTLRCLTMTYL